MRRKAMNDLLRWKSDEERKPMVLKGARQVGNVGTCPGPYDLVLASLTLFRHLYFSVNSVSKTLLIACAMV